VVAMSLAAFLALWALVFAQLVSGHDPVLASANKAAIRAAATGATTTGATTAGAATRATSSSSDQSASALTTRQS